MKQLHCAGVVMAVLLATSAPGRCDIPRNIYGAHLLVDHMGERGTANLQWAKYLVGEYGYAKTLMSGIDKDIKGPKPGWVDWVNACYQRKLIPVCRLAGFYKDGWIKPEADPDGRYESMAEAVKRVVEGLPRSETLPLYIEVWNEPNLDLEWSGKANLAEYARFFVDVSKAIRSIGDSRIKIMNGAFGLSAQAVDECCRADPEFVNSFDVWASHPYPQNHPPEYNIHDGAAKIKDQAIDSYLLETAVLEKHGRKNVKVMITETGYALGVDLFTDTEGYPAINEDNRADYIMRAFRDYWEKWPEIVAVLPFQFSDPNWTGFDWVDPASDTRADGSPTKPHHQYTLVSKLAKSTDPTGAISGKVTDARFGVELESAAMSLEEEPFTVETGAMGNYIRPQLKPGAYHLTFRKDGFTPVKATATVEAGKNAVADVRMEAVRPGSLSGKVTDATTGLAVPGAQVTLTPGGASATTNGQGKYELTDIPPLAFSAAATLEGYNSHTVDRILIQAGGQVARDFRIGASSWLDFRNECSNPSFEMVTKLDETNEIAARWEVQGPGGGAYRVVDGISHSGDRSQSIVASGNRDWMLRMISRYNYAEPGATYTAGVWIKTEDVFKDPGCGAFLSLDFQTNAGETLKSVASEDQLGGTQDWIYLQVTGVAPTCKRISVVLHAKAREGTAYFDDAYLAMVSPAPGGNAGE